MTSNREDVLKVIEAKLGLHPDFPKKGILFRDILPVLGDHRVFQSMINVICDTLKGIKIDRVLGIESRGFLLGPSIAQQLGLPLGPLRKKGKLPGELYSVDYELEYGKDTLQVQKTALPQGSKCLIVDDLMATGGSLEAAKKLVEMSGSQVAAVSIVIELVALNGRKRLGDVPIMTLFKY